MVSSTNKKRLNGRNRATFGLFFNVVFFAVFKMGETIEEIS